MKHPGGLEAAWTPAVPVPNQVRKPWAVWHCEQLALFSFIAWLPGELVQLPGAQHRGRGVELPDARCSGPSWRTPPRLRASAARRWRSRSPYGMTSSSSLPSRSPRRPACTRSRGRPRPGRSTERLIPRFSSLPPASIQQSLDHNSPRSRKSLKKPRNPARPIFLVMPREVPGCPPAETHCQLSPPRLFSRFLTGKSVSTLSTPLKPQHRLSGVEWNPPVTPSATSRYTGRPDDSANGPPHFCQTPAGQRLPRLRSTASRHRSREPLVPF